MAEHDQVNRADDPGAVQPDESGATQRPEPALDTAGSMEHADMEVPDPPATGEALVDDAIGLLRTLPERPVPEHVDLYSEVHGRLHDVLTDLDPDQENHQAGERGGGS